MACPDAGAWNRTADLHRRVLGQSSIEQSSVGVCRPHKLPVISVALADTDLRSTSCLRVWRYAALQNAGWSGCGQLRPRVRHLSFDRKTNSLWSAAVEP